MHVRTVALAALIALAACATAATSDALSDLAGVYTRRFKNSTVDGDHYRSENRLEISRIDAEHASISVSLEFFNGHSCEIEGDALLERNVLVLRPPPDSDSLPACQLHIAHEGGSLVFHDPASGCMMHFCGARGGFEGVTLPYASRRRS